jgi:glutathione S-transferase
MTKIKLTYFDIEGVAEPTRLALALAGKEYEDERVSSAEWKDLKPKTPYGYLPLMTIDDGPVRTESGAMLRWVGATFSEMLYPREKLFEIEQAMGIVDDMQKAWAPKLYLSMGPEKYGYPVGYSKTDEGKALVKTLREKFVTDELPIFLDRIQGLLDAAGGEWLVAGSEPTIVDCVAVSSLRSFTKGFLDYVDPKCLESHPKIVDYVKRFCQLGPIKGRYQTGLGSPAY